MTRYFKNPLKKKTKTEAVEPRALEAIQTQYGQLCAQLGQSQYKRYVLDREIEQLNVEILRVNNEGAARQELDAKAKADETKEA